jgi:hypothetical protein
VDASEIQKSVASQIAEILRRSGGVEFCDDILDVIVGPNYASARKSPFKLGRIGERIVGVPLTTNNPDLGSKELP